MYGRLERLPVAASGWSASIFPCFKQSLRDTQDAKGANSLAASMQTTAICWACTTLVSVPGDGAPAPIFKCGWCGAINELRHSKPLATSPPSLDPSSTDSSPPQGFCSRKAPSSAHHRAQRGSCLKTLHRCLTKLRGAVVAVLVIYILSYIILGTLVLLPRALSSQHILLKVLSQLVAWLLAANVVFNYAAAVMISPGTVQECFRFPQLTSEIALSTTSPARNCLSSSSGRKDGHDSAMTKAGSEVAQTPTTVLLRPDRPHCDEQQQQKQQQQQKVLIDNGRALHHNQSLLSEHHSQECDYLTQGSHPSKLCHCHVFRQVQAAALSQSQTPSSSRPTSQLPPVMTQALCTTISSPSDKVNVSTIPPSSFVPSPIPSTASASLHTSKQAEGQPPSDPSPTFHVIAVTGPLGSDQLMSSTGLSSAIHNQHPHLEQGTFLPLAGTARNYCTNFSQNPQFSNPHSSTTRSASHAHSTTLPPSSSSDTSAPQIVKPAESNAAGRSQGTPPDGIRTINRVPPGSYEGVRYCRPCNGPKPAEAHHCSSCKKCFVGLDHHCPFLDSCVARANQRNFICMLVWTLLAMAYGGAAAVGCSRATSSQEWLSMYRGWAAASRRKELDGVIMFMVEVLVNTPFHLVVCAYIIVASLGVGTAVAALLTGQLRNLYLGTTYVDELLRKKVEGGAVVARLVQPRSMHRSLSHLFGSRHVWAWLLPVWGPAPGVVLQQLGKKRV